MLAHRSRFPSEFLRRRQRRLALTWSAVGVQARTWATMDYYVLQVAGLEGASELIHGIGSADLVRVWDAPASPYGYLAVRGDGLDDALALGRSSGLEVT